MRVYLGIPIYGGGEPSFISALLKTHAALHLAGYEVEVDLTAGCSILPKARNAIVGRFIDSGFDCLVFLDADVSWDVVDFFKLIRSPHLISAIDYRKKKDELEFNGILTGEKQDGWLKATACGAGILCIKRPALVKMINHYPELEYTDEQVKKRYALFDFLLKDGKYFGEDYTFCKRWEDCGGEIAILENATTTHIGTKRYTGVRYAQNL